MSLILSELEASGFVCRMTPFGRTERDSMPENWRYRCFAG